MSDSRAALFDRTVLFDVDGTLVDTNYFHVVAWFRAFRQEGHTVAMADIHRQIGTGSDRLIDTLVPDRDTNRDAVLQAAHTEHYAGFFGLLEPLPGATDLLRAVAKRGIRVVLATSAPPAELTALRGALDAEDVIDTVTSSADAAESKPAGDILSAALQQSGADAAGAVMVGDSRWDVLAAKNAGIPCVGVLSGGIGAAELIEAGAVAVYRDAADLLAHLASSPLAVAD